MGWRGLRLVRGWLLLSVGLFVVRGVKIEGRSLAIQ